MYLKLSKKIFLICLLFSTSFIKSQNIDTKYVLAKAIGAGCGSGNILLERSKKVHLKGDDEKATLSIKSLACTNTVNMLRLPVNNDDENAVFLYPEKAIVVVVYKDNSIAIVGKEKPGSYIIVSVGAENKKAAKALSSKIGQSYNGDFSKKRLAKLFAEQEAMAEAKAAKENLVDFPDKGFKDNKGIGGLYHLSRPIKVASNPSKYTNKLQVEFLPNDQDNIMMYAPLSHERKGLCQSKKYQVEKNILSWHFKSPYFKDGIVDTELTILIEPGVLFIGTIFTSLYEEKGQINQEKLNAEVSKHFVMSKDKNRLNELINNPSELSKLYLNFWAKKQGSREENQMKANPLPPENTAMRSYRAKALTAMRARAKKDRWKATIEAAYVEENTWRIITHNLTGRILYRQIGCIMIEKKDGKCKWRRFSVKQEYNGSGYNKTLIANNYSTGYYYAIDCNKASKYK